MTDLKKLFDAMNRGDVLAISGILFPKEQPGEYSPADALRSDWENDNAKEELDERQNKI